MPTSSSTETVLVCSLGRVDYAATRQLQKALQARLVEAKRKQPPEPVPHVLLLVEHPHVYTLGKSGDIGNVLLSDDELRAVGATLHEIERGGDVTYHGPGQLVGYPILDLDRFFTDLGRYLRSLEEIIIRTCDEYDVTASRVEGRTGTWVGPDARGPERKICAMGVHCSRWVTMHGFAFNLNVDLDYFGHIVPCGIRDRGVTSLAEERADPIDPAGVRTAVVRHFGEIFEAEVEVFDPLESRVALRDLLGDEVPLPEERAAQMPE